MIPQPYPNRFSHVSAGGVIKKPKYVEVEVERPVIVKKYVDIEEDVIVERPVENIVEKEIYIDKVVEVPREVVVTVDKETIREEVVEIPIYREVPYVREIEIPTEKIVHVPRDVIVEKDVVVPRYVDRVEDLVRIKPIQTQEITNEIVHDFPVYKDIIKEIPVEIDRPVYVEKIVNRPVEVEYIKEVDVPVYVDKVIEHPVEVEYIKEVTKEYFTEVDKPVYVDKVVDRPFEVITEVEKIVEKPFETHRRRPVYIDKVVEVPVEKIVEVPVEIEKHVNILMERHVEVPKFERYQVDIEHPRVVEVPIQIDQEVEEVVETVRTREFDVPFNKLVPRPVTEHIDLQVQRIVEPHEMHERVVDVPIEQEVIKEVVVDEFVEKEYVLNKYVKIPKIIPKYVDRFVEKVVDVNVFIDVPRYIERIIEEPDIMKPIEANTYIEKLDIVGRNIPQPMNTFIRTGRLNPEHKARFEASSRNLAMATEEHAKLAAELETLREVKQFIISDGSKVSPQMVQDLRMQVQHLEKLYFSGREEAERLRAYCNQEVVMDEITEVDGSLIPILREQIATITEQNHYLRGLARNGGFADHVRQVGTEVVGHNVTRGASIHTGSRSYSSSLSRSASPIPRRLAGPTRSRVHGNAVYHRDRALRRTSPVPISAGRHHSRHLSSSVSRASSRSYSGSSGSSYYSGTPSRSVSPYPARVNRYPNQYIPGRVANTGAQATGLRQGYSSSNLRQNTAFRGNAPQAEQPSTPRYTGQPLPSGNQGNNVRFADEASYCNRRTAGDYLNNQSARKTISNTSTAYPPNSNYNSMGDRRTQDYGAQRR